jgi:putative transposase
LATRTADVQIRAPRDRNASFQPQPVRKRQTRIAGLDDRLLDPNAGGMWVRDIAPHLVELYGVEIRRDTISRVTDAVLEDVAAWRSRPLDQVYPIVYFDAMTVKIGEDRSVQNPLLLSRRLRQHGGPARRARHLVERGRGRQVLADRPGRSATPRRQ